MNLLGLLLRLFSRSSGNLLNWRSDNLCGNDRLLRSSGGCLRLSSSSGLLNHSNLLSARFIVLFSKLILQSLQLLSLLVDWLRSKHGCSLLVELGLLSSFSCLSLGSLLLLLGHISECLLLGFTEKIVDTVNFSADNILSLLVGSGPLRLQGATDASAASAAGIIVSLNLMLRVKTTNGGVLSVPEQLLTHELTFLVVHNLFNMGSLRPHVHLQLTVGLHGHDVLRLK